MLTIYHGANTRSVRVIWLAEELGLSYEIKTLQFLKKEHKEPTYLAINPLGKLPAIQDGDLHLYESGAICDYLIAKAGATHLEPERGTSDYGLCRQWVYFAEATLMASIGAIAQHTMLRPEEDRIPQVRDEAIESTAKGLGILEAALNDKDYLCGDTFTLADIMTGYDLHLANMFGQVTDAYPNLKAYQARLSARPGFQKAVA